MSKLIRLSLIALGSESYSQLFKCMFDARYRSDHLADLCRKVDSCLMRAILGGGETHGARVVLPFCMHGFKPTIKRTLFVEQRQTRFHIDVNGNAQTANMLMGCFERKAPIRCRLLYEPDDTDHNEAQTVLLHAHGGGYMAGSPDSHEVGI